MMKNQLVLGISTNDVEKSERKSQQTQKTFEHLITFTSFTSSPYGRELVLGGFVVSRR